MRISDWSSDGWSSDLAEIGNHVEGQGLGQRDGELHPLDTEPRMDSLQPVAEQPRHLRAIAARLGKARPNSLDPIIDPVKAEIEPAGADAFFPQTPGQFVDQDRKSVV